MSSCARGCRVGSCLAVLLTISVLLDEVHVVAVLKGRIEVDDVGVPQAAVYGYLPRHLQQQPRSFDTLRCCVAQQSYALELGPAWYQFRSDRRGLR